MLNYANGDPFSTGAITCEIAPLNVGRDTNNRIKLLVKIEDVLTEAVVDTGGIYCILHPAAAADIGFDPLEWIGDDKVKIRGVDCKGSLYRATLRIIADQGESLEQLVTVFVPVITAEEWGELPTFLGLSGCLEFLRFAIDPRTQQFYFASA